MMVLLLMRMLLSRGLSYSFTHLRVHSSYSTQPSDQMSLFWLYRLFWQISGLR